MKTTTRDNILYLTIALGIVGVGGLVIWYQDAHGLPIRMPVPDKVAAFLITTAIVFGYAIQRLRKLWRSSRFWWVIGLLLIAYLPLQWQLVQFTGMRIGLVSISVMLELFGFLFIVERLVPSQKRHEHEGSRLDHE
jgi:hypothetical protein